MNKKIIIYISCGVLIALLIIVAVCFAIKTNKAQNLEVGDKIILEKYDENFEVEQTIEITDKSEIKEINKICKNPLLEQDDISSSLGIESDVKLDLGNGKKFIIQLDLPVNYCYYEDETANTNLVIKMPEGLLEKVNSILETRSENS